MSKNRVPLYLGLAAAGAGGYYLYSAGGSPSEAKHQMRIDAEKAREKLPGTNNAEKFGTNVGKEAGANVDDAFANESKEKLDELRDEAKTKFNANREKINSSVDQIDREVEQKAADAKGAVSGWFGGKK
ncbi:Pc12g15670 [Penicillium rubens Wisconsin 54-1255]|uniref:Pc12g15670 protein n=1 Tax=Penicillium rubens (strain ATCC 28089 / DSM 1075 / NRRL 1951 / Wisconsin 54-1255) TaxID=500485 RepID=B6GY35_PENRW|nr:Pc12g15670 [Penicillium rubens Wisconsin 54-1255]